MAFLDDGAVLTGEAAERRALSEPDQIIREFKRRFGDPTPLVIGGVARSAESVTATLLRSVVDLVSTQQGTGPDRIVLTHPASWSIYRMDLYRQIVLLADLDNVVFLSEPEAAAFYYSAETTIEPGEFALVFDFGGGTFDSAVLRASDHGFEILGDSKGLERLGGIDIDHVVFRHVLESLDLDLTSLDDTPQVRSAVGRLRADCVAAKEALSADTVAVVPVMLPGIHTDVRLTRAEFESMIRPLVLDTVTVVRSTVASAGLEVDAIDRVLLVGGSSRIPLVSQILSEQLQRPVHSDVHPKHTVALGAALYRTDLELAASAPSPASPASPPLPPSPPLPHSAVEPSPSEPAPSPPPPAVPLALDPPGASAPDIHDPAVAPPPVQQPVIAQPAVDAVADQPTPAVPPAPVATKERMKWQRLAIPVVALGLAVGAIAWLNRDSSDGADLAASLADVGDEGTGDGPASTTDADSSATSVSSPESSTSTARDGGADPADLAGGALPFRVVEASPPPSMSGGVVLAGESSQFVFGFDLQESYDLEGTDVIVFDRLGNEVTRGPVGEGWVSGVLDLGPEVWLSVANDRRIFVFETGCLCVTREIAVGTTFVDFMVEHEGLVWISDYDRQVGGALISVIDPVSGTIINSIDVRDETSERAYQHGPVKIDDQLWAPDAENMWVFDLASQAVIKRVELGAQDLSDSVELAGSVFVTDQSAGVLYGVDTSDFGVRSIQLAAPGDSNYAISAPVVDAANGLLWVSSEAEGLLLAVDPETLLIVHALDVERPVGNALIAENHVFLPVGGGQLAVVDPVTGLVVVTLPGAPSANSERSFSVRQVDSSLWLVPPFSADPAKSYRLDS